jgi:hypothetical protein
MREMSLNGAHFNKFTKWQMRYRLHRKMGSGANGHNSFECRDKAAK